MAYYQMLTRDGWRFTENMQRADISPRARLARPPIDREFSAKELTFTSVSK